MGTKERSLNYDLLSIDVRTRRMTRNWTRKQLADMAKVGESAVIAIENATATGTLMPKVVSVCNMLNLSVKRYLNENGLHRERYVLTLKAKGGKKKMKRIVKRKELSEDVYERRVLRGWTQKELSENSGLSQTTVCHIETAKPKTLQLSSVKKVCDCLGLDYEKYFDFESK